MSPVISRAQDVENIIGSFQFGDSGSQVISALLFGKTFQLPVAQDIPLLRLKKSLVDVIGDSERSSVVYGGEHHSFTWTRPTPFPLDMDFHQRKDLKL